jgi:hypothetical protein
MRMIAQPEDSRRYGPSALQAIGIFAACTVFMMALLALLPDV